MANNLVIVESPSKAKTIGKYLGRSYKVVASVGHIRDLPKSKLGVDIENNFEPHYITIRGKGKVVNELKKEAKKAKKVLIATDPDREGEAIAWHIQTILDLEEGKHRVTFNEITKESVKEAVKHPREIDQKLVNSQQARRILDRLVGYQISPILWRKVMKGLSAGRVQSVATRLIVERERQINAFVPQEYWEFAIRLKDGKKKIDADVIKYQNKKIQIDNENDANKLYAQLEKQSFSLSDIQKKEKNRKSPLPFTTASLQREASSRLNFSAQKTMRVAQSLYEGVRIKGGTEGLITYMRTDSTRISATAMDSAKAFILENYGKDYTSNYKRSADKGAQDAHEAIRVTDIERTPYSLKEYLSRDEFRLYELIWKRFVASQMRDARVLSTTYVSTSKDFEARTSGQIIVFDGFLKVYDYTQTKDVNLPEIELHTDLKTDQCTKEQKFTQPPSRYTEATLIKELEDLGIGRPSTYAPTLSTIMKRRYVQKQKKSLVPTELGFITNTIMEENFLQLVETDFTAQLEHNLDAISDGDQQWRETLATFYSEFKPLLDKAEENIAKYNMDELTDQICEKCGSNMLIKKTIKGDFYACSNYPECKNTKPILKEIGFACPSCKDGQIVERKTKRLRTFWGCSNFPECRWASWNKPIDRKCPKCDHLLAEGSGRNKNKIVCTNCDYTESINDKK